MSKTAKPNIIFVFADQLRAGSVGDAGEESVITPNFDKSAKGSAHFKHSVSTYPICTPYRGSLLTGRTPTSTSGIHILIKHNK